MFSIFVRSKASDNEISFVDHQIINLNPHSDFWHDFKLHKSLSHESSHWMKVNESDLTTTMFVYAGREHSYKLRNKCFSFFFLFLVFLVNVIYTRWRLIHYLRLIVNGAFLALVDSVLCKLLSAYKAINFKHSNLEVAGRAERWIVEGLAGVRLAETNVFVHPDCLAVTKIEIEYWWPWLELNWLLTDPPPIVIILLSAAINSSEACSTCLLLSMPTQGNLARSGYSEKRNDSPVPKYACLWPRSSLRFRSSHREEQ